MRSVKCLIDTHVLLWAALSPTKISTPILKILEDARNEIYVSTVSFWEIAIKVSVGKLDLQGISLEDLARFCAEQRIKILEFPLFAALQYKKLPLKENHKDPFDRALISICIAFGYCFASQDNKVKQYEFDGLHCVF